MALVTDEITWKLNTHGFTDIMIGMSTQCSFSDYKAIEDLTAAIDKYMK